MLDNSIKVCGNYLSYQLLLVLSIAENTNVFVTYYCYYAVIAAREISTLLITEQNLIIIIVLRFHIASLLFILVVYFNKNVTR